MNAFWQRITKNCVNTNLIRIQHGSQKPEIIYLPDTWLTCLLGTVVLNPAALQDHLVSFSEIIPKLWLHFRPVKFEYLGMGSGHPFFFFFCLLNRQFLKSSFRFTAKLSRKYREFPATPCPPPPTAIPTINIPYHSGTYICYNR